MATCGAPDLMVHKVRELATVPFLHSRSVPATMLKGHPCIGHLVLTDHYRALDVLVNTAMYLAFHIVGAPSI